MIRILRASDLRFLVDLGFENYSRSDIQFFLSHGCAYNLGLFENDQLLAFALGLLIHGELDIIAVCVQSDRRRQGVATRLIQYWMKDSKVKRAFLEVAEHNIPAINFYLKHGFRQSGRRKKYYEGRTDALVMELDSCGSNYGSEDRSKGSDGNWVEAKDDSACSAGRSSDSSLRLRPAVYRRPKQQDQNTAGRPAGSENA